ncbi:MAG: Gfo/Idh/MocA family oxidoreductase [Verrucomicrobia bacterium]|nr:Gfo/Idh/MocA family oxidoreductase [Verrucomicrobiota bacterium]
MNMISRRDFLKTSLATTATLSLPWTWARAAGANDTIRVGVIGFGGRGREHINALRKIEGVKIVALADVDDNVRAKAIAEFEKRGEKVTGYKDARKLLENKEIDAVTTATPNHWHSLLAIWACQAGKDIYVEKPASHCIWEGRQAVKAAEKYHRIVQVGSQSRSSQGIRQAVAFIRKGGLGKIKLARGLCYKRRKSIGKAEGLLPIPPEIGEEGFELWCGPAKKELFRRLKFHYEWHWFWATGNGDLGNQGVHQVDICRWFLGEKTLAPSVMSIGGRLGYEDDGETANTQIAFFDYAAAPMIFEVRGLPGKSDSDAMDKYWPVKFTPPPQKAAPKGDGKAPKDMRSVTGGRTAGDPRSSIGVIIHCENGFVSIPSYTQADVFDKDGKEIPEYKGKFKGADDHFANFIKAVRSRKTSDLNAPILEGHLSAGLCHQANIAYRVGKKASPDEIREQIKASPVVTEAYGRMCEHLAANGVNLAKTPAAISSWLKFDPKKEQFVDKAANALVKNQYRAPFVVPEKV